MATSKAMNCSERKIELSGLTSRKIDRSYIKLSETYKMEAKTKKIFKKIDKNFKQNSVNGQDENNRINRGFCRTDT